MIRNLKNRFGLKLIILLLAVAFNLTVTVDAASGANAESKPYIDYFKAKNLRGNIRSTYNDLKWSGVTDTVLYNMVEVELKKHYMSESKVRLETSSWLVKILALSGNKKYLKVMEEISSSEAHKKIKKHTNSAIAMLNDYAVWLPIMNKGVSKLPVSKRGPARAKNMLNSSNSELFVIGAKRLYHNYTDNVALLSQAQKFLLKNHSKYDDKVRLDGMSWLIKSLAESMDPKYKPTLEKIAEESSNKKIRKYAKKYAAYL